MEEEIKDGTVISINDKNIPLKIYNDSIIYIKEELKNFDPRYLEIEIIDNLLFDVFLSKSYDNGVNWSELKTQEELIIEFEKILEDQDQEKSSQQTIENMLIGEKIHLSIWCKQRKDIDDVKDIPSTLYQNKNIDDTIPKLYIKTIIYFEQVNPPFKPTPVFIIKPNSFIANNIGLSESIKIVSNLYWNCNTLNDWIILDKNDGKGNDEINFSVTENHGKEDRYGSIIFSSPDYDKEFEITIIQNRANTDDFIELDYDVKNLSNEMQSFVFNIISNTDWLISLNSNDSWIKISPRNGNGNSEILCVVDKNIIGKKTASIKIETKDKKITKYLTVNQDEFVFLPYSGGGTGVKNNPYKLGIPEDLHYMLTTQGHDSGDNSKVYFELYQNIDMSGYFFNLNQTITFSGVFNGKNHTITNFNGERGLFELVFNGIIFNLKLQVFINTEPNNHSKKAAISSRIVNSICANVYVYGTIRWDRMEASSIVGELQNSSIINCYSMIDFTSFENHYKIFGGLVGILNNSENSIINCYWFGSLTFENNKSHKTNPIVGSISGNKTNYFLSSFYPDNFVMDDDYSDEFIPISEYSLNTQETVDILNHFPDDLFLSNIILFENPFKIGGLHPVLRKLEIQDIIYDGTGRILTKDYLLMGLKDSRSKDSMSNDSPTTPIYKVITHKYDVSSDSKDLRIQTIYELINQFPKWNFYDNQQVTIRRWLDQCNSLAESYGHTCVYFKTTPVEVSHTLSVNVVRNVVSIKKLHIMFPNNELPQDRNTFTEWDLALQDDFICHVIAEKFEQAFGKKSIPEQKDYLYLPIINKLFRVTSMQPKNGFMGKIGWWEVFLAKYEEDECVVIEDDLKKAMGGFPEINEAMDTIEQNYENMKLQNNDELKPLLDELEIFKTTTIKTSDSIDKLSIDEKKKSTQNFTDKLNDSTAFLNVKESDSVKEFLSKRLSIVSINPEDNTFPVTMYNCKEVSKRTVGLVYNINDFTKVNKKSNKTNIGFDLNFNYVLFQKFVGEIFDIIGGGNGQDESVIFTIEQNRKKISIILHDYQKTFEVDYLLEEKSFYQICINFRRNIQPNIQPTKNQLAIKIFSIADKQKKLEYQNTYIIDNVSSDKIMVIDKLFLYGGQFFINDIELNIDDKNIIMDNVNPVVQMNKFSL